VTLWEERAARNEALFREVNEEIRDLDARSGGGATSLFVCECADAGCVASLSIPRAAYMAVRANPRRFVVAPGHENAELETVVERPEGYVVVEKYGTPGRIAERLDRLGD
jgi:hypothetical protein